jgi:metallo-beta-lactamase family protein
MELTSYGGAGGVTGSKHLLNTGSKKILFDCGTFQGSKDVRERNRVLPFEIEDIDMVVLSHGHIDHCGMLPLLVTMGWRGPIYATPATRKVAGLMLEDAAGIEEQDAAWRKKKKIGEAVDWEPLFTREDIPTVMEQFFEVPYVRNEKAWKDLGEGLQLKLYDSGHILGSSVSVVEVAGKGRVAYTGDVGAPDAPLLHDPEVPAEEIEVVITESTYGGHGHDGLEAALERLGKTINDVILRKGKIIIPAFSLGRTQAIVYYLHKLTDTGVIPRVPVFVDSPLATDLTDVFRGQEHNYDLESEEDFMGDDHKPLMFRNLTYTQNVNESKALNDKPGPYIVISASGMMTAGRVVHHLRHSIEDPRNAVFVTGYQARGTLGRRLLDGAKNVRLYGDQFEVKAQIELFNEFSAHADREQMQAYLGRWRGIKQAILVHGEPEQADEFAEILRSKNTNWTVDRPEEGETIELVI